MDFLRKALLTASLAVAFSPIALSIEVIRDGLQLEVVYCENEAGDSGCSPITHLSNGINDMALDPLTGHLFIAQRFEDLSIPEGGNIIAINPTNGTVQNLDMRRKTETGTFEQVPYIPFSSSGLDFSTDGTMYFGVSNFLLATWRRENNENVFRTLTSIPNVVDVELDGDDNLFVLSNTRGGPPVRIYDDAILSVDTSDGFFQPAFELTEVIAAEIYNGDIEISATMAVGDDGSLYQGFAKGEVVKKSANSNVSLIHKRDGETGGVNNVELEAASDVLFELDSATGHIYAIVESNDGVTKTLVYFNDALASNENTDSAMVFDGNSLYIINANRTLYKLSAITGSLTNSVKSTLGTTTISGVTQVKTSITTWEPIAEATVTLGSGETTISDMNGLFSISNVPAGIVEVIITKENYNSGEITFFASSGAATVPDDEASYVSQLPDYVAPGLNIEIVADSTDGLNDTTDITSANGNLYVLNNASANILKIELDPITGNTTGTRVVVDGVGGGSSWCVAVDDLLNIYSSFANDGTFKVAELPGTTVTLTQSDSNPEIVTDQNGTNVMISTAKDVDGVAVLSDGSLVMSSGSGGTDTFNKIVRNVNGTDSIYSASTFLSNNDLIKVGSADTLYSTNSNGNLVMIETNGDAELIWPGDGTGKGESIGGYSNFSEDFNGNMFVRGSFGGAPTAIEAGGALRMVSEDRTQLITAVAGIRSWSGVVWENDGQTVYIANKNFVYRVSSLDDRTIAANILDNTYTPPTKYLKSTEDNAYPYRYDSSYFDKILIQSSLFSSSIDEIDVVEEASTGGSGTLYWILLLLFSGTLIKRSRFL